MSANQDLLDRVQWNEHGLVPVIAQDARSGRVLMLAWMNRGALARTLAEGRAVYWSRSRARMWPKGEESGHVQRVLEVRIDCDADTVLLQVEQVGGIACHTGRESCFYRRCGGDDWEVIEAVVREPAAIYGGGHE